MRAGVPEEEVKGKVKIVTVVRQSPLARTVKGFPYDLKIGKFIEAKIDSPFLAARIEFLLDKYGVIG